MYKPELGPLDQRVTLSWLDGILEGGINLEDTEYWFTEPEGWSLHGAQWLFAHGNSNQCMLLRMRYLAVCRRPLEIMPEGANARSQGHHRKESGLLSGVHFLSLETWRTPSTGSPSPRVCPPQGALLPVGRLP